MIGDDLYSIIWGTEREANNLLKDTTHTSSTTPYRERPRVPQPWAFFVLLSRALAL